MSIICIEQEEDSQSSTQFQYERFLSYDENDANDISKMFMDLATHSSPSEPCPREIFPTSLLHFVFLIVSFQFWHLLCNRVVLTRI